MPLSPIRLFSRTFSLAKMLRISTTDERIARPGVSKNSVGIMVVLGDRKDCNEYDLLMSDVDKVINGGAEGVSSADAAIPCFTEVTNQYLSNGVYAGVAMTSSTMRDNESTVMSIRGSPVLALSARYGGINTQVNRGNKNWRQGDHMIIGPEYRPPGYRCLSTWYPVVRGRLFHSNIFNLLCAAFGQERDGWRAVLLGIGEKIPELETKGAYAPDLNDPDGAGMTTFLDVQRELWWTRLSYVTAKVIGTEWTDKHDVQTWITDFYADEVKGNQDAGTFLDKECASLIACLDECQSHHTRAIAADPIAKYTANSLNNGTSVGAVEEAKFKAANAGAKSAIASDPLGTLKAITVPAMIDVPVSFRAAIAGFYKKTMLLRLRGIARSDSVIGGQGLIEIL